VSNGVGLWLLFDSHDRHQEHVCRSRERLGHAPAQFSQELTQAQAGDGVQGWISAVTRSWCGPR
jgi:hypothetical protein